MARRRFQTGSLRRRGKKHPVWELQWWSDVINSDGTLGRKRDSMILGFASELTRKQAWKLAQEHLLPLNRGKVSLHSDVTFGDFIERHFVPTFLPTLKLSTQKRYLQTLKNHLIPAFGPSLLCGIGKLELQGFVLAKMQSGLGWESCNHLRNLMSKAFTKAKEWKFLADEHPVLTVALPEKELGEEKKILTVAQIRALLSVLREPCRTMALLGLLTGMRIGEILGLRWKDVDSGASQLRITQAIYRGIVSTPKTKASRRTLPLPQQVMDAITTLRPAPGPDAENTLVFHSRNGKPLNDTNLLLRHLKPAGKKIGAPWLSWHTLRRTHATQLQMAGGTIRDAQAQLGHTKLSTTLEIYTLPVPGHQRTAVENLAQLVTNGDDSDKRLERLPPATQQIQ